MHVLGRVCTASRRLKVYTQTTHACMFFAVLLYLFRLYVYLCVHIGEYMCWGVCAPPPGA